MSVLVKLGIFVVLIGAILIGLYFSSGKFSRQMAVLTGYSTMCIDGVKYVLFASGGTVKYNKQGQIEFCD